ncbi:MAG: hypothetical protein ACOX1O_06205 [Eggerthellaceae bacterium]|jgi:hypothetical protein
MSQDLLHQDSQEAPKAPFESISFSFNDRAHGRIVLRITKNERTDSTSASPFDEDFDFIEEGVAASEMVDSSDEPQVSYNLHYEVGAADRSQSDTIALSLEQAESLQKALVDAGVFIWDSEYGDDPAHQPAKWSLSVVLQEGVFTQSVRGGSDFPAGFDRMMQAFYAAGLPKPEKPHTQSSVPPMGGFDPNNMFDAMQSMLQSGVPQQALDEMREVMDELRDHPEAFQERLRAEFRALTPEQQDQLLTMLSSSGMVSREWWENFFRG